MIKELKKMKKKEMKKKEMKKRKGQVISLDLIIAMTIFIAGLAIFFRYGSQIYAQNSIQYLISEADSLSTKIIGPGVPYNWTNLNLSTALYSGEIKELGICYSNKSNIVNNKKLNKFIDLINNDYNAVKRVEKCNYNFVIKIPSKNLTFGSPKYELYETKNEVSVTRIVMLNNTLTEIKVIVFN